MKKVFILVVALAAVLMVAQSQRLNLKLPDFTFNQGGVPNTTGKQVIVDEESAVISAIEKSLPSVVTVSINATVSSPSTLQFDPFDFFNPRLVPGKKSEIEKNIGSGFIVSADGLVITNKHVVSDTESSYKVLTNDKKTYKVEKIYRDPLNDLAILKINANELKPITLGDSTRLKLGQTAIAIGTPLGEFTNTVTRGIISGLGRGITAGSAYEGYVEKLDNVIQTDAPINPGNSGGPLLNSSGAVIGVNTAIADSGQSIGFAIPIQVVKNLIASFQKSGGSFERPYIGVRYKMIDKQTAVMNELVEGAYVVEVIADSPAQKAGLQEEDIITEFDGKKISGKDDQTLTKLIMEKRAGQTVAVKIWRDKETKNIQLTLGSSQ
ncbi:MAG: S1C family serine protease [Patescibacteria group bacterium]